MVKSVVLAWGSLVWDPRELQTAAKFAPDGPLLPIEFCRISADGRLTLAIDERFGARCARVIRRQARSKASMRRSKIFKSGKGCQARGR